ncbi:MAG TPA: glycoside hydrolase family 76 protein [Solirubrobacteraceae bacterium]|nr:glycoside hydrolase family 76 protein [Solirubrobacteraceae bacterium]
MSGRTTSVPSDAPSALRSVSCALVLAAALVAAQVVEVATTAAAARVPGRAAAGPPALSAAQTRYLVLAETGVARARQRFRDAHRHWYDERLADRDRYPLATIWDVVPLFESLDALAVARPSPRNLAAVHSFAAGAERYLNRGLRPVPGYSPYPGDRERNTETWFDDNGWWGIAFMNAYRATRSPRYLRDAERALRYIAAAGWDPASGGIWWNTHHPYKAGEAIAAGTLLTTLLYAETHSSFALGQAEKYLAWADTAGFSQADGLYAASNLDPTPIDYIEGPLIYAQALLCRLQSSPALCERAEQLKRTALSRFGYLLDFSPQYDAIYLQWMLALYGLDGDRTLYELAADNARDAQTRALNGEGLYLLSWNGEVLPRQYALPRMLQTHAATTSLFAWLAVYPPPS